MVWILRLPPLCPAGHLPLKGGDRQDARFPVYPRLHRWTRGLNESISPLEGEMSGRTEGGNPPTVSEHGERPHP
jgi:hypothetical protein